MTIGRRMLSGAGLAIALGLGGAAGAQCVTTPISAYNGLVKIEYPRSGGSAFVRRACDAGARQLAADVMAAGKAHGVPVRWVEVYGVRNWGSVFHDLIYKTRALGYRQVGFGKFDALPRTRQSNKEQVVYANGSGKYVAQFSYTEGPSTANTATVFVLYGN